MNTGIRRKKEPGIVRRNVLQAVGRLVAARGLAAVSLDAVAGAAGVSKGGLLHHFPDKRALVDAFFTSLLAVLDARITVCLATDTEPQGRFSRAYVRVVTDAAAWGPDGAVLSAAGLAASAQPELAAAWTAWVKAGLLRCGESEAFIPGKIARYAADGIWLEDCVQAPPADPATRAALIDRLVAMTQTREAGA